MNKAASRATVWEFPGGKAAAIWTALEPLLGHPPRPVFTLRWDGEARAWCSRFAPLDELPGEVREVFDRAGYGCLPVEANADVVHVCHASDRDVGLGGRTPALPMGTGQDAARFTHVVKHDEQQWQYLDELVAGDDIMLSYRPDRTVRGIHPGSTMCPEKSPGCQSDRVVEGIGFRREIPGED